MVVATQIAIKGKTPGIKKVSGELYGEADVTGTAYVSTIYLTPAKDMLTAEDDPILADLWDNEQDAVYDNL